MNKHIFIVLYSCFGLPLLEVISAHVNATCSPFIYYFICHVEPTAPSLNFYWPSSIKYMEVIVLNKKCILLKFSKIEIQPPVHQTVHQFAKVYKKRHQEFKSIGWHWTLKQLIFIRCLDNALPGSRKFWQNSNVHNTVSWCCRFWLYAMWENSIPFFAVRRKHMPRCLHFPFSLLELSFLLFFLLFAPMWTTVEIPINLGMLTSSVE